MASKALIVALRQRTGAGLSVCKQALEHSRGDLPGALQWLQAQGAVLAAAKASRATTKGAVCVGISPCRQHGVLMEVNTETDFATTSEAFLALTRRLADVGLTLPHPVSVPALLASSVDGVPAATKVAEAVAVLGENLRVARIAKISVDPVPAGAGVTLGMVGAYLHNLVGGSSQHGLLATMVALRTSLTSASAAQVDTLTRAARQLAMHLTAEGVENPTPLLEQDFLQSGTPVGEWMEQQRRELGVDKLELGKVVRMEVGEEQPVTPQQQQGSSPADFASEVERQLKKTEQKRNANSSNNTQ